MALYQQGELVKSVSYVRRDTDEWYETSGIDVNRDDAGATIIDELYLHTPGETLLDRIRLLRRATGTVASSFRTLRDQYVESLNQRRGNYQRADDEVSTLAGYELDDYRRDLRSAIYGDAVTWADRSPPPNPAWLLNSILEQERYEEFESLFSDWLALVADVAQGTPIVVDVLDLIADSIDEGRLLSDVEQAYSQPSPDRDDFSQTPLMVFTEGSTDARWLDQAISQLRPDIAEFVRFFDYKESKIGGGANELVKLVRALSEVGIASEMLVLLDNDTAGLEAKAQLRSSTLRPNIRVRSLPQLDFLRSYPTLGPSGLEALDINERAASIECFFGEDILRDQEARLTPIQWTGWNANLKQYQGELINKREVQKRIKSKLRRLAHGDTSGDWTGIDRIIETLIMSGHGPQID